MEYFSFSLKIVIYDNCRIFVSANKRVTIS